MLSYKTLLITILGSLVYAIPFNAPDEPFFSPSQVWLYGASSGRTAPTSTGMVSKASTSGGRATVTTLLTFMYPPEVDGLKCRFGFDLDLNSTVKGSAKLDLFYSIRPLTSNYTVYWSRGNQRGVQLGRLSVSPGASATWDATYNEYLTEKTDCKAPGTVEGFELVGVYDNDFVTWDPSKSGLRIIYTS
ncbi:unnamed protein product [Clonostachys byssicola]|uniref:Ubiquitin 3 binding protein But2 C-terminal domain-containing protein n=1 Tax=Clonostachys byssicola TaxID=160290 RepID=A0A9N9XXK0_9HYPO|nr:unnamed protein product [Clonostachys byssicola]